MTKATLVICLLTAVMPLVSCAQQHLSPIRVRRTATIHVSLPPDQALPLFTPAGEKPWSPGWEYTPVLPADGSTELNMVFTTGHSFTASHSTIWTMVVDDRVNHTVAYVHSNPDALARIDVHCAPGATTDSSDVTVTYTVTGMTALGHHIVEKRFSEEAFKKEMADWEKQIAGYLAKR